LSRIGIYAGTFDPVHAGHITFALQAIEAADLEVVYFLPERRPRAKQQVEHFGHRVAMLKKACRPHPRLKVMEMVDVNFSVSRTLPKLQELFANNQLVFLFGSDVVPGIADWPNAANLLKNHELVIGLRGDDRRAEIHKIIETWQPQPKAVTVFESYAPDVSSGKIREALRLRQPAAKGTLKSVERYSDRHWLYVSLA
jgi:nicotinate-nucleotide adenylyltransferase